MPRRAIPKRAYGMTAPMPVGFHLNADSSQQWVIDHVVGQGGFGRIYCVEEWKTQRGLNFLGIPRFIDKGLFIAPDGKRCRFLVMDRFDGSLEDYLLKQRLSSFDIPGIAIQAFYLVDFGLVALYNINGVHVAEKPSPKLKDNGTLEFCSRDAHKGLPPSRRGDIEILAFNLVHWLYRSRPSAPQGPSSGLPWDDLISDPSVRLNVNEATRNQVVRRKEDSMRDYNTFSKSTGLGSLPALESFLRQVGALGYSDRPNYTLLESTLRELAKSLSLKEKQAVNHTLSARSRAVTKTVSELFVMHLSGYIYLYNHTASSRK
ncbi:unnamed protein product [Schistocephalus solidus]|uniref:Protein kinase domain-containing protein n=1 Tax=Schistocephalus solidus TaxID=70667 RepID=A0A183SQ10_SCHSO|nr:unnamed protein product [Schistocephalus solidus]